MLLAYVLVVAFALPVGIIAGLYRRPRQIILPLLDILQSIPVLGYQPAAIALFVGMLPALGAVQFGYEMAAIFLIFTGMRQRFFLTKQGEIFSAFCRTMATQARRCDLRGLSALLRRDVR